MAKTAIRGLGEVNLWVKDIDEMRRFYVDILGLAPIHESKRHIFLKIADGYEGHPQVVALFDSKFESVGVRPDTRRTTLNHVAFEISLKSYESEKKRLKKLGLRVTEQPHREAHWRSLYFHDPDGNQIELVAVDKNLK
ncbi:MAG TPA: VOC family protein [Nitrososphaerales archaeon]|nr:VOC family protein [Nitrososphaerales archaeon]